MYKRYKQFYDLFSTKKGYYEACKILAFRNIWVNKELYLDEIEREIKRTQERTGLKQLIMGDLCSGDYAWLVRHFSSFSKITYCLDISQTALNKIRSEFDLRSKKIKLVHGDVRNGLLKPKSLDFAYCGFNFYLDFVHPIISYIKPMGGYLFMKPKTGDDLEMRKLVKNYDLEKRKREIVQITKRLGKNSKLQYKEVIFKWQFKDPDLDQIIAALSVVSFGEPIRILTPNEYGIIEEYLAKKIKKGSLTLSQTCSIWCGYLHQI